MMQSHLEISYYRGRPMAAYFYLPRRAGDSSARTVQIGHGMIVDYHADGRAIGIELTAPGQVDFATFNQALKDLGFPPVQQMDLAPLKAA